MLEEYLRSLVDEDAIEDYLNEFQVEKTAKMIIEAAQEVTKIIKVMFEITNFAVYNRLF